jgi:hypothetical protein
MAESRAWAAIATDRNALRAIAGCGCCTAANSWLLVLDQYRIALRQGSRRAVHYAVAGIKAANHFDLRAEICTRIFRSTTWSSGPATDTVRPGKAATGSIRGQRTVTEANRVTKACYSATPAGSARVIRRWQPGGFAPAFSAPSRPSGGRCLQHAGKRRPRRPRSAAPFASETRISSRALVSRSLWP